MMIYKFILSLRRFLVDFFTRNQHQDNDSNSLESLSQYDRLIHRLNCITLTENESKCMHAHLTTILEDRNQDKISAAQESGCIVLEMSEEELRSFGSYVGENTSGLFRAIIQSDNNQTPIRKLRVIGKHGLRLFNVVVKSPNKEILNPTQNKEYIYKDGNHLATELSAALTNIKKTAKNYQHLQSVNDAVACDLVLEKLLHAVLDCIRQLMSVDTVTILLPTKNGKQLAVCTTIGLEEEIAEGIRIPLGCGFAGQIAASGKQMIVEDLSKIEVVSPILRNKGIRSMVGVPLLLKNQANGVFHVGTFRSRQFTKDDVQQLQLVADQIGLAIQPLLNYWKITSTSPNEAPTHVCNKYVGVRRKELVKISLKWDTLVKILIYRYLRLQLLNWRPVEKIMQI